MPVNENKRNTDVQEEGNAVSPVHRFFYANCLKNNIKQKKIKQNANNT